MGFLVGVWEPSGLGRKLPTHGPLPENCRRVRTVGPQEAHRIMVDETRDDTQIHFAPSAAHRIRFIMKERHANRIRIQAICQ